jgi:hypothetical protein
LQTKILRYSDAVRCAFCLYTICCVFFF